MELNRREKIMFIIVGVLVVISIVFILMSFKFSSDFILKKYYMNGTSMQPTLKEGDRFVVSSEYYKNHEVLRGDLVLFHPSINPKKMFVKRVIALSGELFEIKNSKIYINNVETMKIGDLKFSDDAISLKTDCSIRIPKGSVFVLGDNIDNSYDSRAFGPIKIKDIKGKIRAIYFSTDLKKVGKRFN